MSDFCLNFLVKTFTKYFTGFICLITFLKSYLTNTVINIGEVLFFNSIEQISVKDKNQSIYNL